LYALLNRAKQRSALFAPFTERRTHMPKLKNQSPKMCRDKNRAFAWHNGKRVYLGVWKSAEAEKSYRRFKAALLEDPSLPHVGDAGNSDVLILELASGFLRHIEPRTHKSHLSHFKQCIGYLVEVYGELAVDEFSPKKLKVVRSQMVKTGRLCRNQINDHTNRIVRIFNWGVEEELVTPNVWTALKAVKNLPKGEPGTFDHPKRQNVPDDVVKRTLRYITSQMVRAMIYPSTPINCSFFERS